MKLAIPEEFYEEEVRCGYTVSAKMKKVWAVELDLLFQLQQVCEKHNIRWFASGGTILGAIRHKGMIPWDDDIDIMMMRDEYERFCQLGYEFKEPYFLQTAFTDEGYFHGHAQLRNSETTAIIHDELHANKHFNQGIFIDIFPMDNTVSDQKVLDQQVRNIKKYLQQAKDAYRRSLGYDPKRATWKWKLAHVVAPTFNRIYPYINFYKKFEKECTRYNHLRTKYVSKLSFAPGNEKMFDEVSEFDDVVMADFEMLKIPLPVGYEKHLVRQYGDYMKFVIGTADHGGVVFDPDTPYKQWLAEHADEL